MTTKQQNIRNIRRALGTGPVREEQPEPVKKQKVGAREAEARRLREEQALSDEDNPNDFR